MIHKLIALVNSKMLLCGILTYIDFMFYNIQHTCNIIFLRLLGGDVSTLIVSNRLDINGNLGDFASDPSLYFPWLAADARNVQLDRLGARIIPTPRLKNSHIIVGGGGLIGTDLALFRWGFDRILRSTDRCLPVIWGAGFNAHCEAPVDPTHSPYALLEELDRFALVGLRDAVLGFRYVPCPTVMMPALLPHYPVPPQAVVCDNWHFPWENADEELPQMNNNRRFRSSKTKQNALLEVIAFLGSAEVVLTSTYHGALWATMLGKKVVITRPFSTKFDHFRYPPVVLGQNESWEDAAMRAYVYPDALNESLQLTEEFAAEVRELFGL